MKENKEISALLHLLDDPDEYVYNAVSNKIVSLGKDIIPNLENLWENTISEKTQTKIEQLIHRLHFSDLTTDFTIWAKSDETNLLKGALLVAKYHYSQLDENFVHKQIEKLRRNIWLELNNYLTPIEQINIIASIFYNYHKQKGIEFTYNNPEEYLINKAFDNKKGNAINNGIIFLVLCQILDVPVYAINIPNQFILAYFDTQYNLLNPNGYAAEKIKFYIDPLNGQLYSQKDVDNYFKRMAITPVASYFKKLNNKKIIQFLLNELSKCFNNDLNKYKMDELILLSNLLNDI